MATGAAALGVHRRRARSPGRPRETRACLTLSRRHGEDFVAEVLVEIRDRLEDILAELGGISSRSTDDELVERILAELRERDAQDKCGAVPSRSRAASHASTAPASASASSNSRPPAAARRTR